MVLKIGFQLWHGKRENLECQVERLNLRKVYNNDAYIKIMWYKKEDGKSSQNS